MPEATGQAKGNSGVFLQGRYEVQVLDSTALMSPGQGDCGAIYNQFAAARQCLANRPLEWQSYDIIFRAPRFNDNGEMTESPRITVIQNGLVIINNVAAGRHNRRERGFSCGARSASSARSRQRCQVSERLGSSPSHLKARISIRGNSFQYSVVSFQYGDCASPFQLSAISMQLTVFGFIISSGCR